MGPGLGTLGPSSGEIWGVSPLRISGESWCIVGIGSVCLVSGDSGSEALKGLGFWISGVPDWEIAVRSGLGVSGDSGSVALEGLACEASWDSVTEVIRWAGTGVSGASERLGLGVSLGFSLEV